MNEKVRNYRIKTKRCRTCLHARNPVSAWLDAYCAVKNKYFDVSDIRDLGIKGMFCEFYEPVLEDV